MLDLHFNSDSVKSVLFDLDGTVYRGSELVPGALAAIEHCRSKGKQVLFVTNNSAKGRNQIAEKLRSMGIECECEEVMTSGFACGAFVLSKGIGRIYVCGTDDLRAELSNMGVLLCDEDEADALLIGYDRGFDYEKCTTAARVAMRAEVVITCNKERNYVGEGSKLFPGCGAMVSAIEWASNRAVDYVVGKPSPLLLEMICQQYGYGKDEIVMIGDTYQSDIVMADRFGCASILVENGVEFTGEGVNVLRSIADLVDVI